MILAIAPAIFFTGPAGAASPTPAPSRAQQEAEFLHDVSAKNSANAVTGRLPASAGQHVSFVCYVEQVVRAGVMIGQCGDLADPVDMFVKLPTGHLKIGEKLRVLGIMEPPAVWSDVTGHAVYYAFVRAVFVDPEPAPKP